MPPANSIGTVSVVLWQPLRPPVYSSTVASPVFGLLPSTNTSPLLSKATFSFARPVEQLTDAVLLPWGYSLTTLAEPSPKSATYTFPDESLVTPMGSVSPLLYVKLGDVLFFAYSS